MIKMCKDLLLITTANLLKIHASYCQPMRDSQFTFDQARLCLKEPITYSTRTITLAIVPTGLQKAIFVSFNIYIHLQYHWPHMAKDILSWISVCAHCLLKTGTSHPSKELLYIFPIHVTIVTVHIDAWIPGKTMALDGSTSIMIVMCHMTGFIALESFKTA